jgi:potassium efflux system protein
MLDTVQLWPSIGIIDQTDETANAATPVTPTASSPPSGSASTNGSEGSASNNLNLTTGGLPSSGASTDTPADSPAGLPQSLTLADLGLAIVILIFTVVAFRNLPALIEIIVLRRLPLDASARYALSAVLRYAIAIVGIAAAFSALGLSWSKVQWLAAALTFGLAFGLQEIFANFVSGLIILGERPVRIGDTVTVGDVTGTVARIRMRATTITDWDRKELVIPNKTFITERVINWTLSDPVLRVIIPVGVSYGSDVKLVEKTLLKIARAHKFVLKDPAPFVLFTSFADSTLNFELRVYIPHIEHLVAVKHDLHMNITKAFRDEHIEIAFPQRDLHIRDIAGLEKFVAKREDLAKEEAQSPST